LETRGGKIIADRLRTPPTSALLTAGCRDCEKIEYLCLCKKIGGKRFVMRKNRNKNRVTQKMEDNIPYMDKIIPIIVSLASPDQIILFGSYARGENTEKSDVDLLVIKKDLKNGPNIIDAIYMAFYKNKIMVPVDLLAIDYNKYVKINNEIGCIYKTIKEQGKVVYGTL
jgi:predicted nucleotidyltransferase